MEYNLNDVICVEYHGYSDMSTALIWITRDSYKEPVNVTYPYASEDHILTAHWHRADGPAIVDFTTNQIEWWWDNSQYDSLDIWLSVNDQISDEEKLLLKLQYS